MYDLGKVAEAVGELLVKESDGWLEQTLALLADCKLQYGIPPFKMCSTNHSNTTNDKEVRRG
jgi:hypothetical protein